MTTAYTTLLGLALPVQGELQGTWGDEVNNYITNYLDAAVAGTQTISGSQTAVTLSKTTGSSLSQAGSGATGSSQYLVINCTGNPAGTLTITAPAASKAYLIINATSTTQDVKIVGAGPTTGVTLVSGERAIVSWNGSDFVKVANFGGVGSFTTISATTGNITTVNSTTVDTTNLEVTNIKAKDGTASMTLADSTGVASFSANPVFSGGTANGVLYLNGSKVATSGTDLVFSGTNGFITSGGGAFQGATAPSSGAGIELSYGALAGIGRILGYNRTGAARVPIVIDGSYVAGYADGTEGMRLTSTGLGIGTSSPGGLLGVNGATVIGNQATTGTDGTIRLITAGGVNYIQSGQNRTTASAAPFAFTDMNGSSEWMRLSSTGNLGIGTSSPAQKLVVSNAGAAGFEFDPANGIIQTYNRSSSAYIDMRQYALNIRFFTGSSPVETMRLDTSGNLGLGVTPSAWGSTWKAQQFSNWGAVAVETSSTGELSVSNNTYASAVSTFRYIGSFPATNYRQANGAHAWFTAPSGTAGNAISFTQAMTLDASGNLLVGTTTASGGRATITAVANYGDLATGYSLVLANTVGTGTASNPHNIGVIQFGNPTVANSDEGRISVVQENPSGSTASSMRFFTNGGGGNASTLERARITSGGDLLVGTTSNDARLTVYTTASIYGFFNSTNANGGYAAFASSGTVHGDIGTAAQIVSGGANTDFGINARGSRNLILGTNNTERARITSGGYFKASNNGTYVNSAGTFHEMVSNTASSYIAWVRHTAASGAIAGININYSGQAPNDTANEFLVCGDTVANRFLFRSNGGLANYSGNDVNLSDRREKTNFAPAKSYLDTICAIPVQTFEYIDQSEDDPGLTLGVVAQDVQAVAPELVMESNWGTEDNPKMRLSIYQTDLQYALMKCIQELKAQNDELRARVAALEAQP